MDLKIYIPGLFTGQLYLQEWWRYDDDAPWKAPGNRPGPTPFKDCERPFDIIPGGSSVERIIPDVVHTFHIGFGTDLGASFVVWLVRLDFFNNGMNHQSFDDKLKAAYSTFREYCHNTRRFTACDQWCLKKFSMASTTILKSSNMFPILFLKFLNYIPQGCLCSLDRLSKNQWFHADLWPISISVLLHI